MSRINEKYKYEISPKANPEAIVTVENCRFTVLGDKLIRVEYSDRNEFEDRATQTVINRNFEVPEYTVEQDEEKIVISTKYFYVKYYLGRKFTENSLVARFKIEYTHSAFAWHYGKENDLPGTVRTLDCVDGECELEPSIMSRMQISAIDDSKSLIISEDGWIDRRDGSNIDLYLFAYSNDYYGLLKDFYKLCGKTPMLPRYAFGNMWSRYHRYTQQEYLDLMDKFSSEGCPYSVAIIDMDWHLVGVDKKYGSGWTGYTWNKELFPDYKGFLKTLHENGMEVSLNLHPADGVAPYEEMYADMAKEMGTKDGEFVPFDITDPNFVEKYFEILHNPYEDDGVTFWWIDWQQGNNTKYDNLDPLWMLNHFHTLDMKRNGNRPMILSRYAGVGSHRYPVGFSGDTYISWDSLKFQPYFTATAANVGYTWWSHDIGGHMRGIRDDELIARWIQFGVFSPISRLHGCEDPLIVKEPWDYSMQTEISMKKFLRLRHELIPYIYTMNYRTTELSEPISVPLYYKHPDKAWAYDEKYKNEYYFGTELLAMPITEHSDNVTMMGKSVGYLPEGEWFDFFTGRRYSGDREMIFYRGLTDMPVFAKAGAIIPMSGDGVKNDTSLPQTIKIRVFAGDDNTFELYEDDGKTLGYQNGEYAVTKMELKHSLKPQFVISRLYGDFKELPEARNYVVEFVGYEHCGEFDVTEDDAFKEYYISEENGNICVVIENVTGSVSITFQREVMLKKNDRKTDAINFIRRYQGRNEEKSVLYNMISEGKNNASIFKFMLSADMDENAKNAIAEILMSDE